ncbi:hypothetical protein C1H46_009099 [Malus baccata]|uniref:Uncharacterized protein n=1 Tax=Malus baccata TaxID=106549 RepID=A0A540N2T3_MALBA|nr:hypothetical protein C1H46_009099 [Malus baccata]
MQSLYKIRNNTQELRTIDKLQQWHWPSNESINGRNLKIRSNFGSSLSSNQHISSIQQKIMASAFKSTRNKKKMPDRIALLGFVKNYRNNITLSSIGAANRITYLHCASKTSSRYHLKIKEEFNENQENAKMEEEQRRK